jgi:hypothetical protein
MYDNGFEFSTEEKPITFNTSDIPLALEIFSIYALLPVLMSLYLESSGYFIIL